MSTRQQGNDQATSDAFPAISDFQDEIRNPENPNETIYEGAINIERKLSFELSGLTIKEQLNLLAKGIDFCGRITVDQAFKIGAMLILSKSICKRDGESYQEWFESACKFSYETGNNYILIFKHCFGMRAVAQKLPLTLLEKISQPGFPDELRTFLLTKANLEGMKISRLSEILMVYRKDPSRLPVFEYGHASI